MTDRTGAFVRNLTRDDFAILEDDVPQEVASFAPVDLPAPQRGWRAASDDDLLATSSAETLVPEARVYALLLDRSGYVHNPSTQCQRERDHARRVRRLATEFLETSLGLDDVMSVYIVGRGLVQELTQSRPLLRAAINTVYGSQASVTLPPRGVYSSGPCPTLPPISGMFAPGGVYGTFARVTEDLAPVTGRRKAIVWIGGAIRFHNVGPGYREAIRAATRHNVVIHPVDPNGLSAGLNGRPITGESNRGFLDQRSSGSELMRLGALRGVAEDTGGLAVVNTNNFAGGFERIVRYNSSYYLLGYHPRVDHRDGRFHRITVRVDRPGVSVRARRGYFASEPDPVLVPTQPVLLSAAEAAVASLGTIDRRAPLHLRPSWVPGAVEGTGLLWVTGEIDAQARRDPVWAGGAAVEILVRRDNEEVGVHEVAIPAGDTVFAVQLPDDGAFASGEYTLHARVTAAGSAVPWVVTTTVRGDEGGRLGDAVLWRRGTSTGPRHVRTASAQFRRTEQMRLDMPAREDLPASARLLDRTGAAMRVPLSVAERHDDDGATWLVVDVPVTALAPGDYVVEVVQGDAMRLTPFRVVP